MARAKLAKFRAARIRNARIRVARIRNAGITAIAAAGTARKKAKSRRRRRAKETPLIGIPAPKRNCAAEAAANPSAARIQIRGGAAAAGRDEAKPGDEPLDQGLHRILGGAPEKTPQDGNAGDPTGDAVASEAADSAAVVSDGTGGDKVAGDGSGPEAAVEAAAPAEKAPKPRARRRKPAAEAEDAAPAEPVADVAV